MISGKKKIQWYFCLCVYGCRGSDLRRLYFFPCSCLAAHIFTPGATSFHHGRRFCKAQPVPSLTSVRWGMTHDLHFQIDVLAVF